MIVLEYILMFIINFVALFLVSIFSGDKGGVINVGKGTIIIFITSIILGFLNLGWALTWIIGSVIFLIILIYFLSFEATPAVMVAFFLYPIINIYLSII